MPETGRFAMLDAEARLHMEHDAAKWRMAYATKHSKEVERHYRARLVRGLEMLGIGPVAVMGENDPVDLLIAGWACELKVARARAKDHKKEVYQALMHDRKNGHRLSGDVVILLCVDRKDRLWPYLIPRAAVGERRTVEVTSHPQRYRGQWQQYLEAWDVLMEGVR